MASIRAAPAPQKAGDWAMGELEGIGEAVTGGLLARAVEPNAGEPAADGHTHETNCLNCGCKLVGDYCHCCGQKSHVHRSLRAFMGDFVAGLLNFEGKFWRTLPMLAWRPGEMTRRYISGERARFISPVALYLFTVFAMFAVLNFSGTLDPGGGPIGGTAAWVAGGNRVAGGRHRQAGNGAKGSHRRQVGSCPDRPSDRPPPAGHRRQPEGT
jgi:hypothetical protein